MLSGEENSNQYFDLGEGLDPRDTASYARYTINGTDSRGWSEVDDRFDLSAEPHEPFRFGRIGEVGPSDPTSVPQKHSMLGRFKHEGDDIARYTGRHHCFRPWRPAQKLVRGWCRSRSPAHR